MIFPLNNFRYGNLKTTTVPFRIVMSSHDVDGNVPFPQWSERRVKTTNVDRAHVEQIETKNVVHL